MYDLNAIKLQFVSQPLCSRSPRLACFINRMPRNTKSLVSNTALYFNQECVELGVAATSPDLLTPLLVGNG